MKIYLLLLLLACSATCFSQPTNITNQTAATNGKSYGPLHYRKLPDCIGQQFICLPKPVSLQAYGYSNLRTKKAPLHGVKYADYVFKLITLTGFEDDYAVFVTDRNKKLYCQYFDDLNDTHLDSVTPVAEIDSARSLYLGKTLWIKKDFLNIYNPQTDHFSTIQVNRLSPVKVVEVLAGYYEFEPVMFTLETEDHRRGFITCTLSGTNMSEQMALNCSFKEFFFETDPQL